MCCSVLVFAWLLFTATPSRVDAQWMEAKSEHYSIFYRSGYERDVEFTRAWLNRAEQLMKEKYSVTPEHYYMSVYLLPAPTGDIDTVQSGRNRCCTRGNVGINAGSIDLLAPSAPVWKEANLKSSLGLPKADEDFHSKVILSEYIPIGYYEGQDARPSVGWI